GDLLRAHLARNPVRVVQAGPVASAASRAVARLDADGGASYTFELRWDVRDLRLASGSSCLHVGSLGVALAPGGERVRRLAEEASGRPGVAVSYDPNVRPSVTPDRAQARAIAERVAGLAHIVKLSDEDLAFLYPGLTPGQLAARWLGPAAATRLLVVTRGARGALLAARGWCREVAPVPVPVTDTVGAGDAFMAALLAGLAEAGLLAPEALARGAAAGPDALQRIAGQAMAAAALTCTRPGADPPAAGELRDFLAARDRA
ncbi:MAG: carbohydrate kinase, partial [Actinobacteria bacterium]|nr:carbohydrate kinase [Actinomycetota bacterium]